MHCCSSWNFFMQPASRLPSYRWHVKICVLVPCGMSSHLICFSRQVLDGHWFSLQYHCTAAIQSYIELTIAVARLDEVKASQKVHSYPVLCMMSQKARERRLKRFSTGTRPQVINARACQCLCYLLL